MRWIGCVRCKKIRRNFVVGLRGTKFCTSSARFAPRFVRQSNGPESTQMVQTHQNVSLGSNGLDRVRLLRKIPTRLCGTNFCTSSARIAPNLTVPKAPKWYKTHQNVSLWSNELDLGHSLRKILTRLRARTFALVRTVLYRLS